MDKKLFMDKKLLGFFVFSLFLFSSLKAAYVPIFIPVDNLHARGQGSGCMPPVNFSVEHGCSLTFVSSYSINTFRCGNWVVTSDCNGGVLDAKKDVGFDLIPTFTIIIITLSIFYGITMFLLTVYSRD